MFSDDQPVSEVSVSELARRASAVIERVAGGERVVVSKNGRPAALIVSIDDGIEVMLAGSPQFAALRREAREAFVAPQAAEGLERLGNQRKRMIERQLATFVRRHDGREGLFSVRSPADLAACEVLAGGRLVIVYAVGTLAELREKLFGRELAGRLWRRRRQALLHGRAGQARA